MNIIGLATLSLSKTFNVNQGGEVPATGYVFLRGLLPDGTRVTLTGLNADNTRSKLQGKVS